MEKQIKKISKQLNKLNKSFALLEQTYYQTMIKANDKKAQIYYNLMVKNNHNQEQTMENKNQINVFDVVNYMVDTKKIQASNLKLHKLIYYCYAKYLVDYHEKLFYSELQAWRFGPIFPELYRVFKKYGDKIITTVPNITNILLNQNQIRVIDYVLAKYSHFDTWELIGLIQEVAGPWKETFPDEGLYSRRPISDIKIFAYYSKNPI